MKRALFIIVIMWLLFLLLFYWLKNKNIDTYIYNTWTVINNDQTPADELLNTNYTWDLQESSGSDDSIATLNLLNNSKQYTDAINLTTQSFSNNMGRWDIYAWISGMTLQTTNDSWDSKVFDIWEDIENIYILTDDARYIYAKGSKSTWWYIVDILSGNISNYPWLVPLYSIDNIYILTSKSSDNTYKWIFILSGSQNISNISNFEFANIYIDPNDAYLLLLWAGSQIWLYDIKSANIYDLTKSSPDSQINGIVSSKSDIFIKHTDAGLEYISRYDSNGKLQEKIQL